MTIIVEDGTGLVDSNSYGAVLGADEYFTLIGNADWTGADAEKETALINATIYIDIRWGPCMLSERLKDDQALEFPRKTFKALPVNLVRACYEYAVRSLAAPLMPDPENDSSGRVIRSKSEGLGRSALVESVTYADSGPGSRFNSYPLADGMMARFVRSGNTTYK